MRAMHMHYSYMHVDAIKTSLEVAPTILLLVYIIHTGLPLSASGRVRVAENVNVLCGFTLAYDFHQ